jgi:hypothetical protein
MPEQRNREFSVLLDCKLRLWQGAQTCCILAFCLVTHQVGRSAVAALDALLGACMKRSRRRLAEAFATKTQRYSHSRGHGCESLPFHTIRQSQPASQPVRRKRVT